MTPEVKAVTGLIQQKPVFCLEDLLESGFQLRRC